MIKFQGCYHGWHDSVAMNVISPPDRVGQKDPLSQGILPEVLDATIVLPFNDADAVARAFETRPGQIAAVILEPIPHNIGAVLPKPGFLQRLRELCTANGAVLIFDEVITGFRHGLGGYQAIAGVTPDLTTLGKAMANGYPISALGGRADLMDLFSSIPGRPAFFAGTFNGHPAMAAAALATVQKLEREPVHEHVFGLGQRVREGLTEMYRRLGVPVVVSGFGSVFLTYFMDGPVDSYEDLLRNDAELFVGYRRALIPQGIFELPLNLKRSHISYAHDDADVDACSRRRSMRWGASSAGRDGRAPFQPSMRRPVRPERPGERALTPTSTATRWRSTCRCRSRPRSRPTRCLMSTNNIFSPANGADHQPVAGRGDGLLLHDQPAAA